MKCGIMYLCGDNRGVGLAMWDLPFLMGAGFGDADMGDVVEADLIEEGEIDGPPDDKDGVFGDRKLSVGPSSCQSMPCCNLSRSKFSLRASRSSFDLTIFSGW
jgi:hypothetical protein